VVGESEVGLKTADSAPSFTNTTFTTDKSKASKKTRLEDRASRTWNRSRTGIRVALTNDIYLLVATYKKATLKVNGISSSTRIRMLSDFSYKQEIDVILLQEVTHIKFYRIRELQRVRGLWKMNRNLLEDTAVRIRFQREWTRWWEKYVNRNIRLFSFKKVLWEISKTWWKKICIVLDM
jgi:hypothetical protein